MRGNDDMLSGTIRLVNDTRQSEIGSRIAVARSMLTRGLGLMFRAALAPGSGLLIETCSSIHTMWMRFPIDVLYVSDEGRVVRADAAMRPWRVGPLFVRGRYVVELPAGTIAESGTRVGDQLRIEPLPT